MLDCLCDHRTEQELDAGLSGMVECFKEARYNGNVKLAKESQRFIDAVIKKYDLDRATVYGPDPDKPA